MIVQRLYTCPECKGRGEIIDQPCPECGGDRVIQREESLTVTIPVGVEEGMALRVPGHGMPGPQGGVPGDLFVIVRTAPDPRFERAGADLWRTERLSFPEAVLGTVRRVPTLDGDVEVDIPAGSQPGSVLRLAGKGLPAFGERGWGDLYVRLQVVVPEKLTARQRELYQQLQSLEPPQADRPPRRRLRFRDR